MASDVAIDVAAIDVTDTAIPASRRSVNACADTNPPHHGHRHDALRGRPVLSIAGSGREQPHHHPGRDGHPRGSEQDLDHRRALRAGPAP